jgi:hypothetical protein
LFNFSSEPDETIFAVRCFPAGILAGCSAARSLKIMALGRLNCSLWQSRDNAPGSAILSARSFLLAALLRAYQMREFSAQGRATQRIERTLVICAGCQIGSTLWWVCRQRFGQRRGDSHWVMTADMAVKAMADCWRPRVPQSGN